MARRSLKRRPRTVRASWPRFTTAASSPHTGKLGLRLMPPLLHIYDRGALPGVMASKRVTCEGLPTGRTDLVEHGVLVGFLADGYTAKKPETNVRTFVPRNGVRFGVMAVVSGNVRVFSPPIWVVEGSEEISHEALLARMGAGLYVGRTWYTYPINGLGAGNFTCMITGDSYLIEPFVL
jgi:predicted Zn-dependent protease